MEEIEKHECDERGDDLCEGEVVHVPDPYAEELYGEIFMMWLCDYHYEQRALEV